MKRDLSIAEALREAEKRFGKGALVRREKPLTPAQIERMRKSIREEQEKRETRQYPDAERCEFVSAAGDRCSGRRGHDRPREVPYKTDWGAGIRMIPGDAHAPRQSTEKRIVFWEDYSITQKLRGWCTIGKTGLGGLFFVVEADAPTFREAFAKYDEKKAKEREEFERAARLHKQRRNALAKARAAKTAKADARRAERIQNFERERQKREEDLAIKLREARGDMKENT